MFLNFFYNYAIINSLILFLYDLNYTTLYPKLGKEIKYFYYITIILSIFLGFILKKRFKYFDLKNEPKNKKKLIFIISIFFIIDFIYGGFPFIKILKGDSSAYLFKGIPILHVLFITYIPVLSIYMYHAYLTYSKKSYLKIVFLLFLPGIILFSRGTLFSLILYCFLIYFSKFNLNLLKKIQMLTILFVFVYLFGALGNIRHHYKYNDTSYIMRIGEATDQFKDSIVPKEFYWTYFYLTCSLANLQKTVNSTTEDDYSIEKFIKLSLIPSLKSDIKEKEYELIKQGINVGTEYRKSYRYAGIKGLYFHFFYFTVLKLVILSIVRKTKYYISCLVILNFMTIMGCFSNMYIFVGNIFQLYYIFIGVLLLWVSKIIITIKKMNIKHNKIGSE